MSPLLAVAVIVGAVEDGHLTEAGHVAVLLPVASCFRNSVNDFPAVAVGKVNVQFPVNVRICSVPLRREIV